MQSDVKVYSKLDEHTYSEVNTCLIIVIMEGRPLKYAAGVVAVCFRLVLPTHRPHYTLLLDKNQ